MRATVFDIERGSFTDGPGIRTTVFFKGCHLRCRWCHNPEGLSGEIRLLFDSSRCLGCGKCRTVCPHGLEDCELCGRCALLCPTEARELCGRDCTAEELLGEILSDREVYAYSGGGVTFSGGECMLQVDFLAEILRLCRAEGIHTAIDTAGDVPYESFARILPHTDLFLYDIKCATEALHKEGTGVSNRRILDNLRRLLAAGANVTVRIPLIGGFNDGEEEMDRIAALLGELGITDTEILPYHAMGERKYAAQPVPFTPFRVPSREQIEALRSKIESARK